MRASSLTLANSPHGGLALEGIQNMSVKAR
jgi:hypothetical protein